MSATDTAGAADLELVRRAQTGDRDAFGVLIDRNRRAVFRAALAALGSVAEADDVAQEAFVTAFRKLDTYRGDASFKTWLLAITWRKAIDRRKSVARWMQRLATSRVDELGEEREVVDQLPAPDRSQEDALIAVGLRLHLRKLIASLPRKLRDPLLLAASGDYSYDEIAAMLAIPVGTLKWRVSEARHLLREKLKAYGYSRE